MANQETIVTLKFEPSSKEARFLQRLVDEELVLRGLRRLALLAKDTAPTKASDPVLASRPAPRNANTRHAARAVLRMAMGQSVGNWVGKQLKELAEALEERLVATLRANDPTQPGADVEDLFVHASQLIYSAFATMAADMTEWMREYAQITAIGAARDIHTHHGIAAKPASLPPASKVAVLGAPLGEHFQKMADDMLFRFKAAVRQGLVAGDSLERLVQRIEGTDENGEAVKAAEPVLTLAEQSLIDAAKKRMLVALRLADATEASLDKLIQVAISTFTKEAEIAAGGGAEEQTEDEGDTEDQGDEAEPEKELGWTWVAVLDSKTCEKCQYLDGKQWTKDFEPIADAPEWPDDPPIHFNCRCSVLPTDLEADPVEPGMDFDEYLTQFSRAEQEAAFGKFNLRAYRRGDITAGQLIGQKDNMLKLNELARINDLGGWPTKASDPVLASGEGPGHPFRGNQWTEGEAGENLAEGHKESRAARARASYNPATVEKQRYAEAREKVIAKTVGGKQSGDNDAFDVTIGGHGIEVKTIVAGKNPKITMHPDSLARKLKIARKNKLKAWTVAVDARDRSKLKYYLKKGVGSFRLGGMEEISLAELKRRFE